MQSQSEATGSANVDADTSQRHKRGASGALRRGIAGLFYRLERWINWAFGNKDNPFYHLGDLTFYFFYILIVTGTYLFFFYESTVEGSFDALDRLSKEQWYLGGVMRSLHRYAADAMILTMALHILREFVMGRYRGARWFSWFTGVPVLWLVYMSGLVGFWMVWDVMAQFLAERGAEWIDWLPGFGSPMARNFLSNTTIDDLFFRLLIVIHLGISLFLGAFLLLHIKRISKAHILPPRRLATGTLLAMVILSLLKPTISQQRADLGLAPGTLDLDWFYMFAYPLMDMWSFGAVWALIGGVTLLLLVLPWLPPEKAQPVAVVNLDNCNGCGFCAADCPYEAIGMRERSDGRELGQQEAFVIADNCVQCGICTGACPSSNPFRHASALPVHHQHVGHGEGLKSGIEMPQWGVERMRREVEKALAGGAGIGKILVVGCDHGVPIQENLPSDVASLSLPCIGMLPPAFAEYALRHGANGVFFAGCRTGDCFHRLGDAWLSERFDDRRRPFLRRSVDRTRIGICWAAPSDHKHLAQELEEFKRRVGV